MSVLVNRAQMSVFGSPGTGPVTLNTAMPGYQTFAAAGVADGNQASVVFVDGLDWEISTCVYSSTGPALARTFVESSTGSLLNLSSATVCTLTAASFDITNAAVIDAMLFGDGADGNVTVSSGTTTLTRDMYYNNLTLSGTGSIVTNGWRIFVKDTLDLAAAPAGAIKCNGNAGSAATSGSNAPGGSAIVGHTVGGGAAGGAGQGTINTNGNAGNNNPNGDLGGGTAQAGNAGVRTGGAAVVAVGGGKTLAMVIGGFTSPALGGGCGGPGGATQNSPGAASSGGGGGGAVVYIAARTINRDSVNTAVAAIQCKGGNSGGTHTSAGGSAGGGGGCVFILYRYFAGTQKVNAIDVTGGNGNSGSAGATGAGGGGSGAGGRVSAYNVATGVLTETAPVAAVTGGSTTAGIATVSQVAL